LKLKGFKTPADLAALPKAELHVHLEGTVRPATQEEWARRTVVAIPREFHDLGTFVEMYVGFWRTMNSPGDYARLVREYCEDAARAGIRYAELQLATAGRPYAALHEAAEAARRQTDVVVRFIVDVPRSLPVEVGWAMLEAAKGVEDVVAVGLGGPETAFPPEPFAELFAEARNWGLRSVPHAGEEAGPESIRGAMAALGAERIMHGVRAVEEPGLVEELAESGLPLAVCLHSNVRLGVVKSLEEHPICELWDAGVNISVNTDDPGYFHHDMLDEYAAAGRLLELDREGYGRLALNSVDASFAPESLKTEMRSDIADWVRRGG
jgi:adenosine deaminase